MEKSSQSSVKIKQTSKGLPIDWRSSLFLVLSPLVTIVSCYYYFKTTDHFQWGIWAWAIFFYYVTGMSITAGYHRLFSHKTYKAKPIVEWFFALFGAATFQNSIIKWSADHRVHHRYVDKERDPYSASKGFWFSHIGWLFVKSPNEAKPEIWARDLLKNPVAKFQQDHYVTIAIIMGIALPTFLGWLAGSALGGFAVIAGARIVIVHHATFFINSLAHIFGRQPFSNENTARDNGLLAFFTYGEGYHNFHHQFANDYRNGIRWFDYDPTKWLIRGLKRLGLASDLCVVPEAQIMAARMKMAESQLPSHLDEKLAGIKETLAQWREKSVAASEKIHLLKTEYKNFKAIKSRAAREKLKAIKADIARAKGDVKEYRRAWRSSLQQAYLQMTFS